MMNKETAAIAARLMDLSSLYYTGPSRFEDYCHNNSPVLDRTNHYYYCTRKKGHDGFHVAHWHDGSLCCPPWTEEGLLWERE